MEPRLSLVTLGVRDLDRARRFDCDGLGWPATAGGDAAAGEGGVASVPGEVVFLRTGGVVLSLFGRDALAADAGVEAMGGGFAGIALAHNVRERADVDTALAQAVAAGATLTKAAIDASWGGYSGYFADPDGHLWEVAWNPGFPLDAAGRVQLPE